MNSGIRFADFVSYFKNLNRHTVLPFQHSMIRNCIFFFSLLLAFSPLHAQTTDLRYRLQEGKTYRFKQVEETTALAQTNDGRGAQIDRKSTRYFTITIEKAGIDEFQYLFVQDTAIVAENSEDATVQRQNVDFQNVLTKKRVRVRQSPSGKVLGTTAVDPLNVQALFGPGVSDGLFTQRAAIFPTLPGTAIEPGEKWTDARRDTLYPSKEIPAVGRGSGVRLLSSSTEYTAGEIADREGYRCIKVSWEGNAAMEEKIVYGKLEEFTEDESQTTGDLFIAVESGLPVFMDVTTEQENTRALFGEQNNVIPSSVRTHITLELFSQ
jgi:hypothetical protein